MAKELHPEFISRMVLKPIKRKTCTPQWAKPWIDVWPKKKKDECSIKDKNI